MGVWTSVLTDITSGLVKMGLSVTQKTIFLHNVTMQEREKRYILNTKTCYTITIKIAILMEKAP